MAKARFSQPSIRPRSTAMLLVPVVVSTVVGLGLMFSGRTAVLISGARGFLEYYAGVFTLVSLSITVMVGLIATDRMVLSIPHRILLQAAHRGTALTSMAFLGIHITLKVLEGHARLMDVMVPFLASNRVVFIGFGTIAADLMIAIAWTGVIRGRFAGSAHPGIWRAVHALAYVSWPLALVHGLESGRPAKAWVIVSYVACLVFVVLALLVRVCLVWGKRRRGPRATTSGTIKAIGKPRPRSGPPRNASLPSPSRAPAPAYPEPIQLRQEPALRDREPVIPVGRRHAGSGPYGVRGPVSRARLARAARAADAWRAPAMDLTDPGMPRDPVPEEPITAPAAWWRQPAGDGSTGDTWKPPRLTFLDETPDQIASDPPSARPANWEEPDRYHRGHNGEYQVLEDVGGYRPAWHAALEPASDPMAYDDTSFRQPDPKPYAWTEEPVGTAPAKRRRSRRRDEAIVEVTETPNNSPGTRKPAAVLTDEEFWAHMRGDALR